MIEAWALWLFIVGLIAGGVITWLAMVRLPRSEDDVSAAERPAEAAWISRVIERHGGVAPASLVEEVLDLHQAYLADPRQAQMPVAWGPGSVAPPMTAGHQGMQPYATAAPMPGGPPATGGWAPAPGPATGSTAWSPATDPSPSGRPAPPGQPGGPHQDDTRRAR
jgi:hypothetical protein